MLNVHTPLPPIVTPVFLFSPLELNSQNSFLGKKILGSICRSCIPSYAYGSHNFYTLLVYRTKNWVKVESFTVWLQLPFSFVVHSAGCLRLVGKKFFSMLRRMLVGMLGANAKGWSHRVSKCCYTQISGTSNAHFRPSCLAIQRGGRECVGTSKFAELVFCMWLIVNAKIRVNRPTDLTESAWPFFAYILAHGNFLITRVFSILCILPYLKLQISLKPICVITYISTTYSNKF